MLMLMFYKYLLSFHNYDRLSLIPCSKYINTNLNNLLKASDI